MKLIAAFVLVAIISLSQPSVAQQPSCSPIVLAHQPTVAASPFVARHGVHYAGSPVRYVSSPASTDAGQGVVTYSAAPPYTGPQTVYRPQATVAYPGACGAAPAVHAARPAYVAPAVPSGYYLGRGIIGQQKLYATGQPIRNVLRFFTF